MSVEYKHISVLKDEVIELLNPKSNKHYIDCTLGGGGHAKDILEKTSPKGRVIAFELDKAAIQSAKKNLEKYKDRIYIVNKSYVHLEKEIGKLKSKIDKISGIVIDLGVSSYQLDSSNQGFSFKDTGDLDMRFSPEIQDITASDIILTWSEDKLCQIFREYGEERQAKRIATGIIAWRERDKQKQKLVKTSMFVSVILRILNIKNVARFRRYPATKVFQALRIAVNKELENVSDVLPKAINVLHSGGRLAVISFHSLEDRIVKKYFKEISRTCVCPPKDPICTCSYKPLIKIINKKGIKPSKEELDNNPRSRSAILRVVEKI